MYAARFWIGVCALLITACASLQAPSPTVAPEEPSPTPTIPPPTPTPDRLPDGEVLRLTVEGGIAGFCDQLSVTGAGTATLTSCHFSPVSDRLTPEEYAELEALVRPYRFYEGGHRAQPDVADDMTVWVQVYGIGTEEAPEHVVQQALDFGQRLAGRLRPVQSAQLPPVPPLTTYRELALTNPSRALEVLVADLEAYLLQVPGGAGSLRDPAAQADLVQALRLEGSPVEPTLAVGDADGDGRDDLVVGPGAMGVPAVALLARDGTYQGLPVPAPEALTGILSGAWARVHRVDDINGDGRPEVVVDYVMAGASATHWLVFVAQWTDDHFDPLFSLPLTDWGGPASWELLPDGRIRAVCPAFGLFDHKLLPHPSQTRIYAWNPKVNRYALETVEEEQPQTLRQQVNRAEALVQSGLYGPALEAYRQATEGTWPEEEDVEFDLRGWSLMRQGQILFAWGDTGARDRFQQAANARGLAGEVALRLQAAFDSSDPLAPALAWLTPETLQQLTGHQEAWIFTTPYEALAPQLSLSAVLNRRPDLLALESPALTAALQQLGLPVSRAIIANLDNDPAAPELLVELEIPLSPVESYRFVLLMDQSAEARGFGGVIVVHGGLAGLEGIQEGDPPVIQVRDADGRLRRFTWDGQRLHPVDEGAPGGTAEWTMCRVGAGP